MDQKMKELTMAEMQTISGGAPWRFFLRGLKYVGTLLAEELACNYDETAAGIKKGRDDANRMWHK